MSIKEMVSQIREEELLDKSNPLNRNVFSPLHDKYKGDSKYLDSEGVKHIDYLCLNEPDLFTPITYHERCGEKIIGFMMNGYPEYILADITCDSDSEMQTLMFSLMEKSVDTGKQVKIINYISDKNWYMMSDKNEEELRNVVENTEYTMEKIVLTRVYTRLRKSL